MDKIYEYDVAISFAEEDRNAALALALALEIVGIKKVYYYPLKYVATWGRDLEKEITRIYSSKAKYAVVLLSHKYFKKPFTEIELQAIRKRMQEAVDITYMLPVLLENLELQSNADLLKLGYIKWEFDPKSIAKTLKELLGKKESTIRKSINNSNKTQNTINSVGDGVIISLYGSSIGKIIQKK